jgi:uncharacterized protein YecA (UPF0149 family)
MTTNQLENEWQLPIDFLDSKTYLKHTIPMYEVPDNFIKLFNFQSSVPQETPEENEEKNKAILEQVKLGIIQVQQVPQNQFNSAYTQFHPDLKVSATTAKITMLNGQPISLPPTPIPHNDFINAFCKKPIITNKNLNLFGNNKKVGKNEKCPCGSGKKYKVCHGR